MVKVIGHFSGGGKDFSPHTHFLLFLSPNQEAKEKYISTIVKNGWWLSRNNISIPEFSLLISTSKEKVIIYKNYNWNQQRELNKIYGLDLFMMLEDVGKSKVQDEMYWVNPMDYFSSRKSSVIWYQSQGGWYFFLQLIWLIEWTVNTWQPFPHSWVWYFFHIDATYVRTVIDVHTKAAYMHWIQLNYFCPCYRYK